MLEKILLLVMGAIVGILGKMAHGWWKQSLIKREVKAALKSELIEAKIFLALNALFIDQKYGTYDRSMLLWVRDQVGDMKDLKARQELTQSLSMMAKESDKDIEKKRKKHSDDSIKERGIGVDIKKAELPYLTSQFDKISLFGEDVRRLLIDINNRIDICNQEIVNSKKYMDQTNTLTGENHQRNLVNLEDSNKHVGQIAKKIVNLIDSIIPKLN